MAVERPANQGSPSRRAALVAHLGRHPEDLRDIRRLQRRFGLSAAEADSAIEDWHRGENPPRDRWSH